MGRQVILKGIAVRTFDEIQNRIKGLTGGWRCTVDMADKRGETSDLGPKISISNAKGEGGKLPTAVRQRGEPARMGRG